MELLGELAIGGLEVLLVGRPANAQNFIIVTLGHECVPLSVAVLGWDPRRNGKSWKGGRAEPRPARQTRCGACDVKRGSLSAKASGLLVVVLHFLEVGVDHVVLGSAPTTGVTLRVGFGLAGLGLVHGLAELHRGL